jgi:hypothetical protein
MERVTFLVVSTGERIPCLLNPESFVVRRIAGVQPRRSLGGSLTGSALADDPLHYTGGGRTEVTLDLLFDVSLAGSSIETSDVRDFTRPLWEFAENVAGDTSNGRPPLVRLIWGKSFNMPGIVSAVAERFEQFLPGGAPQRSWLRMRLIRVNEAFGSITSHSRLNGDAVFQSISLPPPSNGGPVFQVSDLETTSSVPDGVSVHEILGGGSSTEGNTTERLDEIAYRYYGSPWLWRLLAVFNGINDPLRLPPGLLLQVPPLSYVTRLV